MQNILPDPCLYGSFFKILGNPSILARDFVPSLQNATTILNLFRCIDISSSRSNCKTGENVFNCSYYVLWYNIESLMKSRPSMFLCKNFVCGGHCPATTFHLKISANATLCISVQYPFKLQQVFMLDRIKSHQLVFESLDCATQRI